MRCGTLVLSVKIGKISQGKVNRGFFNSCEEFSLDPESIGKPVEEKCYVNLGFDLSIFGFQRDLADCSV